MYWSRKAALKLLADYDRHDYFQRFIYHKVNQGYKISNILKTMELEGIAGALRGINKDEVLTDKNVDGLKATIEECWGEVVSIYEPQLHGAQTYFSKIISNCKKAVAVDIGWAGSGAISISLLSEKIWKFQCEIIGVIAGTNTFYNADPFASEALLQSGKLVSFMYSQGHNRDLLKKHNPSRDYNIYWELLLSSPKPSFSGFYFDNDGKVELRFGKPEKNQSGIKEIQQGIIDFTEEYIRHFKNYPEMFNISGRDAYAPMLLAMSHNERYLKEIYRKFNINANVE